MTCRVLFVDDDQHILDGLRRSFRSQRKDWEMFFANSGVQALQIAAEHPIDVVVSDMRMPGMDGAELLEKLTLLYPVMVRMLLSGYADEEMIMRASPYAHQFFSKPCDVDTLKNAINRTLDLRGLVSDQDVKTMISKIKTLPVLPSLYLELITLLESPDASIGAVADIVSKDTSMSAKILQLVNSAFFGRGQRIASTHQATTLLGVTTVKNLILTVGLFQQYDASRLNIDNFSLELMQEHCLKVSVLAAEIAKFEQMPESVVEDCFLAGMLHDIGKLIMATNMPEQFRACHELANSKHCSDKQIAAEQVVFKADHGKIGAYLLGLWSFPASIIQALAYHHQTAHVTADGFTPLLAVHVADALHSNLSDNLAVMPVGVDMGFVDASGFLGHLDDWRAIHTRLMALS